MRLLVWFFYGIKHSLGPDLEANYSEVVPNISNTYTDIKGVVIIHSWIPGAKHCSAAGFQVTKDNLFCSWIPFDKDCYAAGFQMTKIVLQLDSR